MEPLLKFEHVTICYNGENVVQDINLELNRGEYPMSLERSAANFCTYSSWTFKSSSLFKRIVGAMMPMEPANAVMMVRPFLVRRLFADSASAVRKLIEVLRMGLREACISASVGK